MAVLYYKADTGARRSMRFTRRQLPWLVVLIICGVFVDMLHIQIAALGAPPILSLISAVVEDGGEMIAASFLTAISVREAVLIGADLPACAEQA